MKRVFHAHTPFKNPKIQCRINENLMAGSSFTIWDGINFECFRVKLGKSILYFQWINFLPLSKILQKLFYFSFFTDFSNEKCSFVFWKTCRKYLGEKKGVWISLISTCMTIFNTYNIESKDQNWNINVPIFGTLISQFYPTIRNVLYKHRKKKLIMKWIMIKWNFCIDWESVWLSLNL